MTIYFQHVGEKLGQRDFPKTLGTPSSGLRLFRFADIEPFLNDIEKSERDELRLRIRDFAPDGFQIWGIPTGAKRVLRNLAAGDHLLLLETPGPGGHFVYAGVVIAHPSKECFDLSQHLWGEQRFAIVVLTRGILIDLSWLEFCSIFGYKDNWNPAGQTYRIGPDRLEHAGFEDEAAAIVRLAGANLELVNPTYSFADDFGDAYLAEKEVRISPCICNENVRQHLSQGSSGSSVIFHAAYAASTSNMPMERWARVSSKLIM